MYPPRDIDKAQARGDTLPVDPEMREAFDRLGANLHGEISSVDANLRGVISQVAVDLRGEMRTLGAELRGEMQTLGAELRGEMQTMAVDLRGEMQTLGTELRSEIQAQGADLRGEMQALGAELRSEIRSGDATTLAAVNQLGVDLRGEIQTSAAGILQQMLQQMGEFESRMRRHFDVAAESVRAESRFVAEGAALLSQRMDRRDSEDTERHDGLEGRVVKLEVRVKSLEDKQKPRRRPR
jgi:hypothetical protein